MLDGEDDGNCLADDHEHHQDEGRAQRFVFDKLRFILHGGSFSINGIEISNLCLSIVYLPLCFTVQTETSQSYSYANLF